MAETERRSERAWGACAVNHNVQPVRWCWDALYLSSCLVELKNKQYILFLNLLGLACCGLNKINYKKINKTKQQQKERLYGEYTSITLYSFSGSTILVLFCWDTENWVKFSHMSEWLHARLWSCSTRKRCALPMATKWESHLYWFPQTSLHPSVLATAAEADERERERERRGESSSVGGGEWYTSSTDVSQYLMKMGFNFGGNTWWTWQQTEGL